MSDETNLGIGGAEFEPLPGTDMLGDPHTWCPDLWLPMTHKYGIRSMIDVGCGIGGVGKWFLDHGVDAYGVEGYLPFIDRNYLPKERLYIHDYETGPLDLKGRTFDLAWAAEFVEHVREDCAKNFLETFAACKHVLMTHALPDQGGYHHVNENTTEYWVNRMKEYGFTLNPKETAAMRYTANWAYGRCTLTFFSK